MAVVEPEAPDRQIELTAGGVMGAPTAGGAPDRAGTPTGFWRTIARNSASNWGGQFAAILVGFFLSPFLVYALGRNGYGVWAIIGSVGAYFSVLDLGIGSAVVRYVAKFRSSGDTDEVSKVVNTALVFFTAMGVLVLAAGLVMARLFARFFQLAPGTEAAASLAMAIVSFEMAIALPIGVFGAVLVAEQRYDISNGLSVLGLAIRTVLILILVKSGYGVVALAVASLSATVLSAVPKVLISFRLCRGLRLSPRLVEGRVLKLIAAYGAYSFLAMTASRVIFYSDSIVIGTFVSAAAVTAYVIAWNLVGYAKNLTWGLANVLIPASSGLEALGNWADIRRVLIWGTRLSLLIALPLTAGLILLGRPFISLWMGPQYASSAAVLTVLAASHAVYLSQSCAGSVLYGVGKHRPLAVFGWLEAAANLALSLLLVRHYGILGVAIGTAVPQVFFHLVVIPAYALRVCKVRAADYLTQAILPGVAAVVPFIVCAWLLPRLLHPVTWFRLAAVIAASVVSMAPGAAMAAGIAPSRLARPRQSIALLWAVIRRSARGWSSD